VGVRADQKVSKNSSTAWITSFTPAFPLFSRSPVEAPEARWFSFSKQTQNWSGVKMKCMRKKNVLRRRRLTSSVRKRITSYYTESEQEELTSAAATQGVSLSSFIASAALKEARKINPRQRSR
jgi:hypothetical protein